MISVKHIIVACLTLMMGACATTSQGSKFEQSGSLGDYSVMEEGEKGEGLLVYRAGNVDVAKYDKIWVDPVTIWCAEDSKH